MEIFFSTGAPHGPGKKFHGAALQSKVTQHFLLRFFLPSCITVCRSFLTHSFSSFLYFSKTILPINIVFVQCHLGICLLKAPNSCTSVLCSKIISYIETRRYEGYTEENLSYLKLWKRLKLRNRYRVLRDIARGHLKISFHIMGLRNTHHLH